MHNHAYARQVLALGLLFVGTIGLSQVQILYAQTQGVETIVVRRGDEVFDVKINSDMSDQVERWNGLRDRAAASVTLYVVTGKGYKSYIPNFCYRYKPKEIHDSLIKAFDSAGDDIAMRKRAAMILNYFGDQNGVDWALEQIEAEKDPQRLQLLTGLFSDWFRYQTERKLVDRRFEFTPGIERMLASNLHYQKFDIRPWVRCIDGDEFQLKLQAWLESGDVNWQVGKTMLVEMAKRSPQQWQLDLVLSDLRAAKGEAKLTNAFYHVKEVLKPLAKASDPELKAQALAAYEQGFLKETDPLWQFNNGFDHGVPFSDALKRKLQDMIHESVKIDLESASDNRDAPLKLGLKNQIGWQRFGTDNLARVFQGTADEKVLATLRSRLVENDDKTQQPFVGMPFKNVDELMAIEMVSGKPLSRELLGYLADTQSAVARMEYHCRMNQKTPDDVFKLFHQYGFATDLNPTIMKQRFADQVEEAGSISGWRELLGTPTDVGMFEVVRGVFLEKERWRRLSYERYINSFWYLVDASGGEFDPKNFTVLEDKTLGRKMVGFTWRGKSFYFPFGGVIGFVPPLNAILRHEGSKNGFAQVMGRPTGGFLTASTPKVAFGPVEMLEALETDFGLTIVGR
ncbi:MAG: hypothetical protein WBD20_00675 [Pirellulaceae bacterium]